MATCCECETDFDVDEFDVERGDRLSCSECGANLVVAFLSPLVLEPADDMDTLAEDDDDDDDDPAGRDDDEIDTDDWE